MRLRSLWLLCWSSSVCVPAVGGCDSDSSGEQRVPEDGGETGAGRAGSASSGGAAGDAGEVRAGAAPGGEAGAATAGGGGGAGLADAGAGSGCPHVSEPAGVGVLDDALHEASGLAASVRNPGVFYAHNDSNPPLYAIAENGAIVASIELPGALASDWEDIAVGPGPDPAASYIYVGDIGDNDLSRNPSIGVHRLLEPEIDGTNAGESFVVEFVTLYFRYPDGPHNAEGLFVDPIANDLYIVTKGDRGGSELFVGRAPHRTSAIAMLEHVATLPFGSDALPGSALATGATISADGARVLIRTYDSAFLWLRAPGASIAEAFAAAGCAVAVPDEPQGEAISFRPDGLRYYTTSEGRGAAIHRVELE